MESWITVDHSEADYKEDFGEPTGQAPTPSPPPYSEQLSPQVPSGKRVKLTQDEGLEEFQLNPDTPRRSRSEPSGALPSAILTEDERKFLAEGCKIIPKRNTGSIQAKQQRLLQFAYMRLPPLPREYDGPSASDLKDAPTTLPAYRSDPSSSDYSEDQNESTTVRPKRNVP